MLDTCAVIAFLHREPGGERLRDWLREAAHGDRRLLIHRVALGEVYYLKAGADGVSAADARLTYLRSLPWEIEGGFSFELLRLAGRLKAEHGIPYVDALSGAWSWLNDAALATTDRQGFSGAAEAGALDVIFLR